MERWKKATNKYILITDAILGIIIAVVLIATKEPEDVNGLTVTESSYNTVSMEWDESQNADAYLIYKSGDGKKYEYVESTVENKFTDKDLRTGTKYYYKVTSRNGLKSSSIEKTKAADVIPKLETPKLKIDTSKGIIKLNFTDVDGASGYQILRDGETIQEVQGTSFVDDSAKGDKLYNYEVKAVRYKKEPVYSKASNQVKAELHAIQDFSVEPIDNELMFQWAQSEYYDEYKIYNGEELLGETHEGIFRMADYKIDETYNIKLVGYSSENSNQSPEANRRFMVVEEPMDNEGAINAACEWGVQIANDDSFSYGTGSRSHRYGCYFCGTNVGPAKNLKGSSTVNGHSYAKTYCCNPFVHACYAHGAGDQNMLNACRNGKGIGHSEGSFTRYGNWKNVGRPAMGDLHKGDVLVGSGHVMMYIGNGEIVHAKSEGWGAGTITTDNASRFYGLAKFVMRYTGTGSGTMKVIKYVDENDTEIEIVADSSEKISQMQATTGA